LSDSTSSIHKIKFSGAFYQNLGVTQWQMRSGFSAAQVPASKPIAVNEEVLEASESVMTMGAELQQVESVSQPQAVQAAAVPKTVVQTVENPVVVIGHGLQDFWQDDESLEWRLWSNIMQAFNWHEEQVLFVDSALLTTEEQAFASVEEIIGMGAERLLSMDDEHPINEMLSEGAEILSVPDFDLMLSDPYAKKSFYQQAISLHA
jgi:DNA polymerase III psi subunit